MWSLFGRLCGRSSVIVWSLFARCFAVRSSSGCYWTLDCPDRPPSRDTQPFDSNAINYLSLNPINAFKRNVLRAFQYTSIPNKVDGKLFDITLTFLKSNHEAIAVRVFSMTILRQICEKHPELSAEVGSTIEMILEENKSGGIQSRGKKELKKLKNLTTK